MATLSFTPYHSSEDISRSNAYISDGHGNASAERSNRYISDGHGAHTVCVGFHCPDTPELATAYMALVRKNYERQHPVSPGRIKKPVTHYQFYFSPTGKDNVPATERVQMTLELIERTELKDFPSLIVPHDNTDDPHTHISLCPYSLDGTKKLSVNNHLVYQLRRESDRICVEHGYSIVECPELFGDKDYYAWFQEVKENGIVTIHPPKEQNMTTYKKDRKRSRSYAAYKSAQASQQKKQDEYLKKMTAVYTPETSQYFYVSPIFYDPRSCKNPLTIRTITSDGKTLSDLAQRTLSQAAWANIAISELTRRKVTNSGYLAHRLKSVKQKSLTAHKLLQNLDIQDHSELICHIKEVGCDIASLKKENRRLESLMAQTPAGVKLQQRKTVVENLLKERSTEYRHLKEAETILHPAASQEEWQEYLSKVLGDTAAKKIGKASPETIQRELRQMGKVIGLEPDATDDLIKSIPEAAAQTSWVEYQAFMRSTFDSASSEDVSSLYQELGSVYDQIRKLRQTANAIPVVGLFSFLLAMLIAVTIDSRISLLQSEIETLKWEIDIQKEYAKETKREKRLRIKDAKETYEEEILDASDEEIQAAQVRYYSEIAKINGRLDVLMELERHQADGSLDAKIMDATRKKLTPRHQNPPPYRDYTRK